MAIAGMTIVSELNKLPNDAIELIELAYTNREEVNIATKCAAYAVLHTSKVMLACDMIFDITPIGSLSDIINMMDQFNSGDIQDSIDVEIANKSLAGAIGATTKVNLKTLFAPIEITRWINRRSGNPVEVYLGQKITELEERNYNHSKW